MGEIPSVRVFLMDHNPRVSEKTTESSERLSRQPRPWIEPGTSNLPVLEHRIAQPLVGPRTDSLTSMPYPGFEPGTFGVAAGTPSHYTAWSVKLLKGRRRELSTCN